MKVYQVKWSWNKDIESWLSKQVKGFSLHACCGMSRVGSIRLDLDERCKPNILADVKHLPFKKNCFDTVICDPPFKFYNKFRWIMNLADLCRGRLILFHPLVRVLLSKKYWSKKMYAFEQSMLFMRLVSVWDKTTLLEIMK